MCNGRILDDHLSKIVVNKTAHTKMQNDVYLIYYISNERMLRLSGLA